MNRIVTLLVRLLCGEEYIQKHNDEKARRLLRENGNEALEAYKKVGEELNFSFVPLFGTLLGAYREHDFIAHDDDIDMGLNIKYLSIQLFETLIKYGFEIHDIFISSDGRGCQLPMKYKELTCDIYFLYNDNDSSYHTYLPLSLVGHDWAYSTKINLFRYKDICFPYCEDSENAKLGKTTIAIPANTHDILTKIYGDSYMTPIKGAHADPPMNEIPVCEKSYRCLPLDFFMENGYINYLNKYNINIRNKNI